jgi:hypothetical protein
MRNIAGAIIAFLLSLPAFGVYVSGSGLGQALIYPYFTTQSVEGNAFNTYFTIANGHSQPKALRVRLREGRNGREIANFNLFLPAGGIWAGAIAPYEEGAQLVTIDPACTEPSFLFDLGKGFFALSTDAFTGARDDNLGTGRDRLREGYIEVLEMASFESATLPSCENLRAGNTGALAAPQGYAYGMLTLINVMNGMDFTENAVALANLASAPYFRRASDPYPDFTANEVDRVAAFTRNDKLYRIAMPSSVAAVEAAMVAQRIDNELVLDSATASATDWVLTMPTKRLHRASASSPWFAAGLNDAGVATMDGTLTTRSGSVATLLTPGCGFPCPAYNMDIRAPWAASVLGFRAAGGSVFPSGTAGTTGALGSRNGWNVSLPMAPGGAALELHFFNSQGSGFASAPLSASTLRIGDGAVGTEQIQLTGLPVIGFMARTFRNGTLNCSSGSCQGNYGGSSAHRLRRVIDPQNDR